MLRRFALVPLSLLLAACGHATRPAPDGLLATPDGRRVIDAQAIEQSGARTAWDALQRTVPFFTFRENSRGRPTRVEHRGRSSIILRDQPLILVDGVLTGVDATTYYGTNATKGAIRIRTKVGKS